MWSETVRTDEQLDHMLFPRLLALSERAWHRASWELDYTPFRYFNSSATKHVNQTAMNSDWAQFANILAQRELPKLEAARVAYRVAVPGALRVNGTLLVNVELPGVQVYASVDGGEFKPCTGNMLAVKSESRVYVRAGNPMYYGRAGNIL